MRGLGYHQRPRKLGAQKAKMERDWPLLNFEQLEGSMVRWTGKIRGFQKWYLIAVYWDPEGPERPYVVLLDPPLRPCTGGKFGEIPHLMFHSEHPELSGLCLFHPEGREWSNKLLIADTTMRWVAEWLMYYELWHFDGVWRGGGVGPESIAEARAAAVYRETGQLVKDATPPAAVAGGYPHTRHVDRPAARHHALALRACKPGLY